MRRPGGVFSVLGAIGRLVLSVVAALIVCVLVVTVAILAANVSMPRVVEVPNVAGLSVEEAEATVRGAGLDFDVSMRTYSASTGENRVIRTRPSAGKRVKSGRLVSAVVSMGPREIPVPSLIGLEQSEAEQRIRAAYLVVGTLVYRKDEAPAGQVLEQEPKPKTTAARGEPVNLVLSGGPEYGRWKGPGDELYLFRRVKVVVPGPDPVQDVRITTRERSGETQTVYDRVHQPGDELAVDVYGKPGARVQVLVHDDVVFETRL